MSQAELASPGLARKRSRYEQARALLAAIAAVIAVLTLALSVVLLVRLTDVAESNRENGQVVRDCVDPTGKCFRDGQRRTGEAVASIADAQIAAVACSQEAKVLAAEQVSVRNAAIKSCVAAVLTGRPPR